MKVRNILVGLSLMVGWLIGFSSSVYSEIPRIISFQGVLKDAAGNIVPDGEYRMTFRLYTVASGGTPIWTEVRDRVRVENGLYNVLLGEVTSLAPVPFDKGYWLGVAVGTDPEMTPRYRLASSPYALNVAAPLPTCLWTQGSGNDIYRVLGNVGIGTINPRFKLDVAGDIRAKGVIKSGDCIVVDGSRNTIYYWNDPFPFPPDVRARARWNLWFKGCRTPGDPPDLGKSYILFRNGLFTEDEGVAIELYESRDCNKLWISAYDEYWGNIIYTMDPKNKKGQSLGIGGGGVEIDVGIWGWMAPFPRFVVNSDDMFLGYSIKPGDGSPGGGGDGKGNLYVRGNVGIGTTVPAYKLDVVGDIRATGMVKSGGGIGLISAPPAIQPHLFVTQGEGNTIYIDQRILPAGGFTRNIRVGIGMGGVWTDVPNYPPMHALDVRSAGTGPWSFIVESNNRKNYTGAIMEFNGCNGDAILNLVGSKDPAIHPAGGSAIIKLHPRSNPNRINDPAACGVNIMVDERDKQKFKIRTKVGNTTRAGDFTRYWWEDWGTTVLTITQEGNVGIGVPDIDIGGQQKMDPARRLHIRDMTAPPLRYDCTIATTGVVGIFRGYIPIDVNGTVYYLPLYQ